MFLVDRQIGQILDQNDDSPRILLRVADKIAFNVHLQVKLLNRFFFKKMYLIKPSREGRIYPPHVVVRYTNHFFDQSAVIDDSPEENSTTTTTLDNRRHAFQLRFSVDYFVDSFNYDKTIEVSMATLCSVSVLLAALKAYSWGRRAGKIIVDSATVVQFVLYTCENISNVFLFVIGSLSVWIFYAYKLQQHLVYLPPSREQEWSFIVYMIMAAALKCIVFLHTYIQLSLIETFFIDWERPRLSPFLISKNSETIPNPISREFGGGGGSGAEMVEQEDSTYLSFGKLASGREKKKPFSSNPIVIWLVIFDKRYRITNSGEPI